MFYLEKEKKHNPYQQSKGASFYTTTKIKAFTMQRQSTGYSEIDTLTWSDISSKISNNQIIGMAMYQMHLPGEKILITSFV